MQLDQTAFFTKGTDQHYHVQNVDGYLLGAPFVNGVMGQLSLYEVVGNDTLQFVRLVSETEHVRLAQQPVMTWYVLTHSRGESIALLRCRYNPHHTDDALPVSTQSGQVGV